MSVELLLAGVMIAVGVWLTLGRGSWKVIGTADGRSPAAVATLSMPSGVTRSERSGSRGVRSARPADGPAVRLVPTEGFISHDRAALIAEAEARLEGHIAYERVQLRPGWLLFDPVDIVGQPPVVVRFASDRGGPEREVWLYGAEDIRRLERSHSYLAECRRASIQARWDERKAAIIGRRAGPLH